MEGSDMERPLQEPQEENNCTMQQLAIEKTVENEGLDRNSLEAVQERDQSRTELVAIIKERDYLNQRLVALGKEKDELSRKLNASVHKVRKLNEIIVRNSQRSDEPPDDEIQREMFNIRNMLTIIVRTYYDGDAKFDGSIAGKLGERYHHFYLKYLKNLSPEGRKQLLIALIFEKLEEWFFESKRFGTDSGTESSFQSFERQIETSNKGMWMLGLFKSLIRS
jgi:hypothetical protein